MRAAVVAGGHGSRGQRGADGQSADREATGSGNWTAGSSNAYSYDAAGHTITRPGQTLDWNAQDRLDTVHLGNASTGNVYDADGNLLIATEAAGGRTLYLGDTEVHLVAGSSTPTGIRTYYADACPIAERSTDPAAPSAAVILLYLTAGVGARITSRL